MKSLPLLLAGALTLGPLSVSTAAGASNELTASAGQVDAGPQVRYRSWVVVHPFWHHRKLGQQVRLSGQVRYRKSQHTYAAAGAKLRLYRRPDGSRRWLLVGADRTSHTSKPTYDLITTARGNSTYQVRFGGNTRLQPSSRSVHVWVHRPMPSRVVPGLRKLRMVGHVRPSWQHKRVALLKRDCRSCGWHTVRRQSTDSRSRFRFVLGAPPAGRWYFKARVRATDRFAQSTSATYRTFSR